MQHPPEPPYYPPQEPYQPPYQQPTQAYNTQPYPQPGQYAPGLQPSAPRRPSKRKIGCIIAASIGGGLLFLLTICFIIGTLFPPPTTSPGDNPFVVPTFASNATPTAQKTATPQNTVQASAITPTGTVNSVTPTIASTPTLAPAPTPTAVPPTPTPIPTPTPRPGPNRAQVDELINKLHGPDVKSYDEKTGTLVVATYAGSAIVVDQKFVKERMQDIHEHIWQSKLYFASVTVEYYHNRKDTPPIRLSYSVMRWATASQIDWGALFGVGDLWEKYDEKWLSSHQADYDGQGL